MPTLYACVVLLGLLGLPGADGPGENTATTKPRDELATLLVATRLMDDVKCETSPHFEILRTGDADVAKLEARLEGVYAAHLNLMQELGITPHSGGRRIRVLYLANKHQFDEVRRQASAPVAAGGFYVRSANFAAFFDLRTEPSIAPMLAQIATLPTERRQRAEQAAQRVLDKYARQAIQHEAAHAIQFNIGLFDRSGDVPSWLAEGLAQAFELWEPGVDDVLSRVHTERAAKFRRMYATPADLPNLSRLIADDASWQPSRDDAMAWALVHYLWQARRAEFTEYVQRMSRRGEEKLTARQRLAEFADVFGPPDGVFGERLHAHILGLQTERTP